MDGPVAGSLMGTDLHFESVFGQQGGGGVLVWAAIIKDELVGPFRVEDGLKLLPVFRRYFLQAVVQE